MEMTEAVKVIKEVLAWSQKLEDQLNKILIVASDNLAEPDHTSRRALLNEVVSTNRLWDERPVEWLSKAWEVID